jgi:putative SOS response-associated peptidase YedK
MPALINDPTTTSEWVRTFVIITIPANELVATIHDRMPAILYRDKFDRCLGSEPDPRDLLQPFPSEDLRMWPVTRLYWLVDRCGAAITRLAEPSPRRRPRRWEAEL